MPTYDYACSACGHTMEVFQGISEDKLVRCPECSKHKLERLFGTGAGFVFKGSGFYETDYRSESYKKAAAKESGDGGPKSGGDSKTPKKTTSKSKAAKPKQKPDSSS